MSGRRVTPVARTHGTGAILRWTFTSHDRGRAVLKGPWEAEGSGVPNNPALCNTGRAIRRWRLYADLELDGEVRYSSVHLGAGDCRVREGPARTGRAEEPIPGP